MTQTDAEHNYVSWFKRTYLQKRTETVIRKQETGRYHQNM